MAEAYKPSTAIAKALARLQEQKGSEELPDWRATEAQALVRYIVLDCLLDIARVRKEDSARPDDKKLFAKTSDSDLLNRFMKAALDDNALFEQANMKKKLQSAGLVAKVAAVKAEYE